MVSLWFKLYFLILFLFGSNNGFTLSSILWDPSNPIFNAAKCSKDSTKFCAIMYDEINLLCGNQYLNTYPIAYMSKNFFYNVYSTTNITEFENRDATNLEPLHKCHPKWDVKEEKLYFDHFKYIFKQNVGQTVYFFTTSDGTKKSLDYTVGLTETKHMQFSVSLRSEENLECRHRVNLCLQDNSGNPTAIPLRSEQENTFAHSVKHPMVLLLLFGLLVFGVVIGMVASIYFTQFFRKKKGSVSTSSFGDDYCANTSNLLSKPAGQKC
ncbi:uncharacterized protein LOC101236580 isoform X1 [Hydra vulgaris]|uniref:uncharacterized protein LOC101236580 isoform X1 n=1 Tax=Hydra vulgaris TaxID=6087 RepID=UPI001F5F391D|nr:uncharacterized protein LOC101236580 isoform X1 [Hydra vulgaris]